MPGDLIRLIIALRITHPLAHILVSGQIVQQLPHLNAVIRADSVIGDAMDAMKVFSDQA